MARSKRITGKQRAARKRNIKIARKSRNSVTTRSFLKKAKAHGVSTNPRFKKSVSKLSPREKTRGMANMSKLIRRR